jgi:hypothetical protein
MVQPHWFNCVVNSTDLISDLKQIIAEHGWAVRRVVPRIDDTDALEFAYTIGLTGLGHPEVVIYGLPVDTAHALLNDIGSRVRTGQRFGPGQVVIGLVENDVPIAFLVVQDTADLTAVEQIYGAVHALQMVWPDRHSHFPWDDAYALAPEIQPLKGLWNGPTGSTAL